MRLNSIEVSSFERAILERMALRHHELAPVIPTLHVVKREFTGAGSYTELKCAKVAVGMGDAHICAFRPRRTADPVMTDTIGAKRRKPVD